MRRIVLCGRTFIGVVSLSLVVLGNQNLFAQASRPVEEMRGGCSDFAWNLQMEIVAMGRPAKLVRAAVDREKAFEIHPDLQPLEMSLHRKEEVFLLSGLQHKTQSAGNYAGWVVLTVPEDGVYRMSTAGPIWFEVMSESGVVQPQGFEMQTGCAVLFKSAAYFLQTGTRYWIQIVDSMTVSPHVLVTRVP